MNLKACSLLLLVVTNYCFVYAQNTNPYIPKILSPSPNAAALMKFTDVPVSTYNGTADISVPFCSVDLKDISVPVGISYHTGGVRVKEEASLVGLGWALNAGGMISREIRDQDDFGGEYFNEPVPEITANIQRQPQPSHFIADFGATGYIFFCDYILHTDQGDVNYNTALQGATTIWDMEPDIFSYNFPGHSGKFILSRAGKVLLQKQENIVVQYSAGGGSFTITDDQGNVFYFADKELVQSANYVGQKTSSWMLSKITTQSGDVINFTYQTDNNWSFVAADIFETYRTGCSGHEGPFLSQPPANQYLNLTLKTIDYPKGQIQFQSDSLREDLQNGRRLNSVKIYSKVSGTTALTYLKEYDLYYSYFSAGLTPTTEYERLKLDSCKELSTGIALPPYQFSYNVSNGYVPKHGYGVDHWGFNNGQGNVSYIPTFSSIVGGSYLFIQGANRDVNPVYSNCFSLSQITYPTGGHTALEYEPNNYDQPKSTNGPVDFPVMNVVDKQQSIDYGGGGARGTFTCSIDLSNIYPVSVTSSNATLNVTFLASNAGLIHTYINTFRLIYFVFDGITVDINDNDLTCTSTMCTIAYPLTIRIAQSYSWSLTIDPSIGTGFSDVTALVRWQEIANVNNPHLPLVTGGLRIKSITDYSSNSIPAKKRKYVYDNEDPVNLNTYGRLMSPPSYARLELLYYSAPPPGGNSMFYGNGTTVCSSVTQTGSSNNAITSIINGNIVGYDTVKEYLVDPVSGIDIGKTVYAYFNSTDTVLFFNGYRMPGLNNMGNNLNGSLLSKIVYKNESNSYIPVTETDNFYHTTNRTAVYSAKYNLLTNPSGYSTDCPNNICNSNEYQADFFPSIKSEKVLLDSTYETVYDQLDPTRSMVTKKYYSYDNPKHFQITRIRQQDSKGNIIINNSKYPQDYIPNGNIFSGNTILDSMIKRNMVSSLVENRDSLYFQTGGTGFITSAKLNTYKILSSGSIDKDKIYMLNIAGPVANFAPYTVTNNTTSQDSRYRQMISFDSYDNLANIKQYTATDQIPVSIVWDYANMFPVAQVKNAVNSDVAFSSFEADGTGNWTFSAAGVSSAFALTGRKSFNLSGNSISKSGLVSGNKYIVSYWSRGGAYTITGGTYTSLTGRSVSSGWTYIQQLVAMTSTTLTITGASYIDELRLYPQAAQMTSLTYTPLVGATTSNDPNSEISFYEYDSLQRLKNIKDYQGNILNNFQYNYAKGCTSCNVPMQTFAHTNTISYPVGVFSVANKLLGNAKTQTQFDSLWNSDFNNSAVGTLTPGADSMHFILTVKPGQISPGFVTGCRYYQYDLPYTQIDAVRNSNGVYVDYGDHTGMFLGKSGSDSNVVRAFNTIINVQYSYATHTPYIYWIHSYPDTTLKTITFYHNDATESMVLDNAYAPATSLTLIRNLRGNLPQNTTIYEADCNQQPSVYSVAAITNWNSISSITSWGLFTGDVMNACLHVNYPQDFLANNRNLQTIVTGRGYYYEGTQDTTFKISRLKSNWNTYFTNLTTLEIDDDHWNREDLSALINLNVVGICADNLHHSYSQTNNPLVPIPVSVVNTIINQISAGAGRKVVNGVLNILSGGTTRTSASDPAVAQLKSKGWTIYVNGVLQ